MAQIAQLKAKRDICQKRLENIVDSAKKALDDNTFIEEFKVRYSLVNDIYEEFNTLHKDLIGILASKQPESVEAEDEIRLSVDNNYFGIIQISRSLIGNYAKENIVNSEHKSNVRLPKINLPVFDGEIKTWPTFYDLFNSLIHMKNSLTDIEKFQYLIASLSKEPLSLIRSIPVKDENYQIAYETLVKRYQNKRVLSTHYLESIFNVAPLESASCKKLRYIIDTFSENLSCLDNLGFPVAEWDFILFNMLLKKIDPQTRTRFERDFSKIEIPTYVDLKDYLFMEAKAMESNDLTTKLGNRKNQVKSFETSKSKTFLVESKTKLICIICQDDHPLYKCKCFLEKSVSDRFDFVKHNKLCIKCLNGKHLVKNCTFNLKCKNCQGHHNSLLHFEARQNKKEDDTSVIRKEEPSSPESKSEITPTVSSDVRVFNNVIQSETVLLATAIIEVEDSSGKYQRVRVLIDNGSQVNIISETCLRKLGLSKSPIKSSIYCLNEVSSKPKGKVSCKFRPCGDSSNTLKVETLVVTNICGKMPGAFIDHTRWSHISNLKLADENFNIPGPVEILLGAEVYPFIMKERKILGETTEPAAFNSIFGWLVLGKLSAKIPSRLHLFHVSVDDALNSTLKLFWELDQVPDNETKFSEEEVKCEKLFADSFYRLESGRFVVKLPFKDTQPSFVNSRSLALNRLYSLERRLSRNPKLQVQYSEFMQDYWQQGHMELTESSCHSVYYIPHHCVVKEDSLTTKLRVVFDAAAKDGVGVSLNNTLLTGPKLQNNLIEILTRFRIHLIVVTADIKQMYRQILVDESHRDYQRIVYRFNPESPVLDFRLNTVTYGISSAPFLAIRVLRQLAEEEKIDLPQACDALLNDTYVDDVVTGSDSIDSARNLCLQLAELCKKGGFTLHKWASNEPSIFDNSPVFESQTSDLLLMDNVVDSSVMKVLGLQWSPTEDSFSYKVSCLENSCTKRNILSELARVFDPLGFLSPVLLYARSLIQKLWCLGISWDECPPLNIINEWRRYKSELCSISNIRVPRLLPCISALRYEMHGFCDASETGYGAVVYLRTISSDNNISIGIVIAKSKVAPLKKVSIPRLELCSACLLAKLIHFVYNIFKDRLTVDNIFAWSDSSVTLSWIGASPHRWKTFVANRVSYIQDKVPANRWFHVSSGDNPADCASRGVWPADLKSNLLWWTGPAWLLKSQDQWPDFIEDNITVSSCVDEEKRCFLIETSENIFDLLLEKFSSLSKILRILTYCLKFCGRKILTFTDNEMHEVLILLIKHVQHQSFSEEINNLNKNLLVNKQLRSLSLFLDDRGLLRVGGRLQNANLSYDCKHPILLPRCHRLTDLIIDETHTKYMHPGRQHLEFLIRQKFWILSAKRIIRSRLSKCIRCFRTNPNTIQPIMGNLPPCRVNEVKAFQQVGVDYGGPFYITLGKTRGAKTQKAYLCLFVCLATKAVHLELASDLSSEAFLASFRRFIARRGKCTKVFSDCGTNFIGAKKYIVECMKNAVEAERVEWSFIPPSAPHFGGIWEAGIKSVKSHLVKIIGAQIFTFEEFYTILVQIEAILNSRPLYALSSDPNDLSVLTPGHFLTLAPLNCLPEDDLTRVPLNRLGRWQLLQNLHQHFWQRWHKEYLNNLQQRLKWSSNCVNLKKGTLVLIKQDNVAPLKWPLGRIIETFPGQDGKIRVATVRTATWSGQRPIVKLCPLPIMVDTETI